MLQLPSPVSINEAAARVGVGRKHLYLRANDEARAIADRHRRHGSSVRQERELKLQTQIGEILDERLAAGAEGMSAREIWNQTGTEAKSVAHVFRHIRTVVDSRQQ
ncbi:MAG: hypothetical protein KDH20_09420 [Rhodocyclaceae bacterium]|nr:hypothetical protein [Rhodocyclaceae bacterium]